MRGSINLSELHEMNDYQADRLVIPSAIWDRLNASGVPVGSYGWIVKQVLNEGLLKLRGHPLESLSAKGMIMSWAQMCENVERDHMLIFKEHMAYLSVLMGQARKAQGGNGPTAGLWLKDPRAAVDSYRVWCENRIKKDMDAWRERRRNESERSESTMEELLAVLNQHIDFHEAGGVVDIQAPERTESRSAHIRNCLDVIINAAQELRMLLGQRAPEPFCTDSLGCGVCGTESPEAGRRAPRRVMSPGRMGTTMTASCIRWSEAGMTEAAGGSGKTWQRN